jgi:hypothetical protein
MNVSSDGGVASPVIPCDCGCWPDLGADPGFELWMALYLDLLDIDPPASLDMVGFYLAATFRRMRKAELADQIESVA